jgi:hypothetical protein
MEIIKMKLETMGRQIESTQTSMGRLVAQLESIFQFGNESARPKASTAKNSNESTPATTSPCGNFLTPGISQYPSPKLTFSDSKLWDRWVSGSRKWLVTGQDINSQNC